MAIILALSSAIIWSMILLIYRHAMLKNADASAVLIFSQIGALILCLIFFPFPDILSLNHSLLGLLLISGAFWAIGVYTEIRALAFIDTSASGVIGSFRYVLACLIGQYFFKENFSFLNIMGACLIMLAVIGIGGLDFKKFNYRTGFLLQIFASCTQVIAYSLDKYLSASLSAELVTTCSYFFPALLFLILNPKKLLLIPSQIKLTKYWLCLIPVGVFLCYYALVKSFSIGGEFKIGMALVESSVVINWIFAYFLLKERNEAMQKLGFCVLCFLGICLITI